MYLFWDKLEQFRQPISVSELEAFDERMKGQGGIRRSLLQFLNLLSASLLQFLV